MPYGHVVLFALALWIESLSDFDACPIGITPLSTPWRNLIYSPFWRLHPDRSLETLCRRLQILSYLSSALCSSRHHAAALSALYRYTSALRITSCRRSANYPWYLYFNIYFCQYGTQLALRLPAWTVSSPLSFYSQSSLLGYNQCLDIPVI